MRKELNELIRAIVDTRFAVEGVAIEVIQSLRQGEPITYRGHYWDRQHFEVMEKVRQGVEAAWHYAKWLQFPEMASRLDDGADALSHVIDVQETSPTNRLTDWASFVASPAALESPGQEDGKDPIMARTTVAELEGVVESLQETVGQHVENLNEQIAALEERIDELEESADQRKSRGRQMSDEDRKAAGERMQMGRAKKLGLDSVEQLRALKLRPGTQPTKKEIAAVKKQFPADD